MGPVIKVNRRKGGAACLLKLAAVLLAATSINTQAKTPEATPIAPDDVPAVPSVARPDLFRLEDSFEREDASTLGGEWTDCKSVHPDSFEPLGIYDGGVVISEPYTRSGQYDLTPPCPELPKEGHLYPAIGCAFVDTHSTTVAVRVTWSGNHGIHKSLPIEHVEGTPLLYITPGNSRFGFGAWPSELYGKPILFAGYIGMPAEEFEAIAVAMLPGDHEPGTAREIELRAEEPGLVTVWVDGKQVSFEKGIGLKPLQVDEQLVESTRHGIAVDAHCVDPSDAINRLKGIEDVSIKALGGR